MSGLRLNPAIQNMEPYTLRKTDVNPAEARARELGAADRLIEGRLGDPTRHGLYPYPGFIQRIVEIIELGKSGRLGEMSYLKGASGFGGSAYSYTDSAGFPPLRELIGAGNVPMEQVFIGAGVSGIARTFFEMALMPGDEIVIPKWTYILYLSEAARRGARVVSIDLDKKGQPDAAQIEARITEKTKAIVITTVGNPIGVAMDQERFDEIVSLVNAKEREFGHPIYLLVDSEYVDFIQDQSKTIDPVETAKRLGREGPTIEFYSISKMLAYPGERIGWMKMHWGEGFAEEKAELLTGMSNLLNPMLGGLSTSHQIALYVMMRDILENQTYMDDYFIAFERVRRTEVNRRVNAFLKEVVEIPGIVVPEYYRTEGGRLTELASFYVMFGVDGRLMPRSELSQARRLADFAIDTPGLGIPLLTPGDAFLAQEFVGQGPEYIRAVALLADDKRKVVLETIREFAEMAIRNSGWGQAGWS